MAGLTSALILGATTLGGAALSSKANSKATSAATSAASAANAQDLAIYNQQRADLEPWRVSGGTALAEINKRLGLGGGTAPTAQTYAGQGAGSIYSGGRPIQDMDGNFTVGRPYGGGPSDGLGDGSGGYITPNALSTTQVGTATPVAEADRYGGFYASPGYQFRLDEGNRNIVAQRAATGTLASGDAAKALTRYGQDYASNEFNTQMNQLFSVAGLGQTATSQGNALASNYGNNVNANNQTASNALQSSYANSANIWGNALGTLGGIGYNYLGGKK